MAGIDKTALQQFQHRFRQVEQTQTVCQCAAALAQLAGGLLLCQVAAGHQLPDAGSFFHRVQILALQILYKRQLHGLLVGHILDDHRHLGKTRHAGGAPAALACHDAVTAHGSWPHRDGLQQAVLGDAGSQLTEGLLLKGLAGLVGVRLDLAQRQRFHRCVL